MNDDDILELDPEFADLQNQPNFPKVGTLGGDACTIFPSVYIDPIRQVAYLDT